MKEKKKGGSLVRISFVRGHAMETRVHRCERELIDTNINQFHFPVQLVGGLPSPATRTSRKSQEFPLLFATSLYHACRSKCRA